MRKLFIVLLIFNLSYLINAQSYISELPSLLNEHINSDTLHLKAETDYLKNTNPKKIAEAEFFGQVIKIDEQQTKMGNWSYLGDQKYLWRLVVKIEEATAINAYLSDVKLNANEELFIYNPTIIRQILRFDSKDPVERIGTSIYKDNTLIFDFISNEKRRLPFQIREIGYSTNPDTKRDFGDAGSCEISVNCPEGQDYRLHKNSVSRILVKQGASLYWCTGSLINNTKKDGKPYLITANHCGKSASIDDYSDWVFDFNFESPDCDMPIFEPEKNTVYGSKLLAHSNDNVNSYSDFKLLLLSQTVPSNFKPYYIGWDRSGNVTDNGVCIHHPQGDIKMISSYDQPLVSTSYHNENQNNNGLYWMVNWSETWSGHGVTEGGSSGSPILNQQGLLVGTLTGGDASCTWQDDPDWYGKFSYHWESNGSDSTNQLKYWLDPLNTGVGFLNGTNLDSTSVLADFISNTDEVTIGGGVEFTNLSSGNISSYNWFFEGGEPEVSDQKEPPVIKYYNAGSFDVKLVVSSASGSDSTTAAQYITVRSSISPSVTTGEVKIKVGDMEPENVSVSIFNTQGQELSFSTEPSIDGNGNLLINISHHRAGMYIITLNLDGFSQSYKIIKAY